MGKEPGSGTGYPKSNSLKETRMNQKNHSIPTYISPRAYTCYGVRPDVMRYVTLRYVTLRRFCRILQLYTQMEVEFIAEDGRGNRVRYLRPLHTKRQRQLMAMFPSILGVMQCQR